MNLQEAYKRAKFLKCKIKCSIKNKIIVIDPLIQTLQYTVNRYNSSETYEFLFSNDWKIVEKIRVEDLFHKSDGCDTIVRFAGKIPDNSKIYAEWEEENA